MLLLHTASDSLHMPGEQAQQRLIYGDGTDERAVQAPLPLMAKVHDSQRVSVQT